MIMKKLKQLGLVAILAVVCVLAGNTAMAQQQQQERAASGQSNTLGSSSRIDATKVTVNKFISAQEANISGIELTVNQTHTTMVERLGTIRNTLVNFNTTPGGCDPRLGPQGCKCACGAPDQKLLWDASASKWQCYQVQNPQCTGNMQWNPNTCKCETTSSCTPQTPPQACEPGQQWNKETCRCCSNCNTGPCPAGYKHEGAAVGCGVPSGCICNNHIVNRRPAPGHPSAPYVGLPQSIEDMISYRTVDNCPVDIRCTKPGMRFGGYDGYPNAGIACCCASTNQKYSKTLGRCGDVCPDGWSLNNMGTGCYKPTYFTVPVGTTCSSQDGFDTGSSACSNMPSGHHCCRKDSGLPLVTTDYTFGVRCLGEMDDQ